MTEARDQEAPFWNRWEIARALRRLRGLERRDSLRKAWPRINAEREAQASGKLVRFVPRPYRQWSTERILARMEEFDTDEPISWDVFGEYLDLEAELEKRGVQAPLV